MYEPIIQSDEEDMKGELKEVLNDLSLNLPTMSWQINSPTESRPFYTVRCIVVDKALKAYLGYLHRQNVLKLQERNVGKNGEHKYEIILIGMDSLKLKLEKIAREQRIDEAMEKRAEEKRQQEKEQRNKDQELNELKENDEKRKQEDFKRVGNHSWFFDKDHKPAPGTFDHYSVLDAPHSDKQKVVDYYQRCSVPGMEVGRVRIIFNPTLSQEFCARVKLLQAHEGGKAHTPTWSAENEPNQRRAVLEDLEEKAKPYKDVDYPDVKILPLWHGTPEANLDSIFKGGFAALGTTDPGFYGRGIYSTYEAKYAYHVYCKLLCEQAGKGNGALLVTWVAMHNVYPVIHGDKNKLAAKGGYKNYDAYVVPVKPRHSSYIDQEMNYDPCEPNEKPTYHEFVSFTLSQGIPGYLVELQPALLKAPSTLFFDTEDKNKKNIHKAGKTLS